MGSVPKRISVGSRGARVRSLSAAIQSRCVILIARVSGDSDDVVHRRKAGVPLGRVRQRVVLHVRVGVTQRIVQQQQQEQLALAVFPVIHAEILITEFRQVFDGALVFAYRIKALQRAKIFDPDARAILRYEGAADAEPGEDSRRVNEFGSLDIRDLSVFTLPDPRLQGDSPPDVRVELKFNQDRNEVTRAVQWRVNNIAVRHRGR